MLAWPFRSPQGPQSHEGEAQVHAHFEMPNNSEIYFSVSNDRKTLGETGF